MKTELMKSAAVRAGTPWWIPLGLATACVLALAAEAQTVKTWTAGSGNFYDGANWSPAGAPVAAEIGLINNGGTANIAAAAGSQELGTIRLGDTQNAQVSGHVIMNGGTLIIGNTQGDPKAVIGFSAQLSTFIMNGGTILFDGPDREDIAGSTNGKGRNELDWEVGERGLGRFEMHNNAVFRAADDLKVAENAAGNGSVLIDGSARLSVGSGISISGNGGDVEQSMVIGGNALVDSGNSMGAGNPLGHTDEGYLTMAFGNSKARLTIQDQGVLNIRRLTAREGLSTIIVKDHGQFHIFDVLNGTGGSAANRPAETGPNSTYASLTPSDATLILQDDAQMTVNSDPASGPTKGLGISAQRDAGNPGGTARLIVRDRASFRVEQDLMIGTGRNPATSDGTLEVVGPNASVAIGGNLDLAVDLDGNIAGQDSLGFPKAGKATLSAVITGPTHATVHVTGTARIANGILKVSTDGFTPAAGATYTVLMAMGTPAFDGQFAKVDTGGAAAPAGHTWAVEYTADSVRVKVVPGPGRPDDNGVPAATSTLVVNPASTINNNNTESLGVAVAANGNVVVGWEDDGDINGPDPLKYIGAAWTLYDGHGVPLTPTTPVTSLAYPGVTLDTMFLSYFRADGSATPAFCGWGPRIKANLFGDGFGMGSNANGSEVDLGVEVIEFGAYGGGGGFPGVQLLAGGGQPQAIVAGAPVDYSQRTTQSIRIGDWDYLANGNVVIVGESRQSDDLVDLYGGASGGNHAIYRIVSPTGAEVKAVALVSEEAVANEIWHGVGVTRNGFGVRFSAGGRAKVRLFDNAGAPTSGNIDLGTLAGDSVAAGNGRGDSVGFHGNGHDAYVAANYAGTQVRITVINADGTLRYSKSVIDDVTLRTVNRLDAAISRSGQVLVVFTATYDGGPVDTTVDPPKDIEAVLGRLLDATGNPLGGTFRVGEIEPLVGSLGARNPRAAWNGNTVAVAWQTKDGNVIVDDGFGTPLVAEAVALRLFNLPSAEPLSIDRIAASGQGVTIGWTGGTPPYLLEMKTSLGAPTWSKVLTTTETQVTVPNLGGAAFFRVQDQASGQVIAFSAYLSGAAERPTPVITAGTGTATLSFIGNQLSYAVAYSGLTGDATAGHIHLPADAENTAPPKIFFPAVSGKAGVVSGTALLAADELDAIVTGKAYVNIHTTFKGGGEIRGQIIPQN